MEPSGNWLTRFPAWLRMQEKYFDYHPQSAAPDVAAHFHLRLVKEIAAARPMGQNLFPLARTIHLFIDSQQSNRAFASAPGRSVRLLLAWHSERRKLEYATLSPPFPLAGCKVERTKFNE